MAKDIPGDRPPPPPPAPPDDSAKSKAAAATEKIIGAVRDTANTAKDTVKVQAQYTMSEVKDTASKAANWASENKDKAVKKTAAVVATGVLLIGPTGKLDDMVRETTSKQPEGVATQGAKGITAKADYAGPSRNPFRPPLQEVGPVSHSPRTPKQGDPLPIKKMVDDITDEAREVQRRKEEGEEDLKNKLS